jgi:hypothetical protein
MAVSFVLAMPVEPFQNTIYGGDSWAANSCGVVYAFLSLSFTLQAVVTPLVLFLLPGPGSILRQKISLPSPLQGTVRATQKSAALFVIGIACAGAIPLVWWRVSLVCATSRGLCPEIFNLSRQVDYFQIDYVHDCQVYYIWFSIVATLWVGVTAGALRLQSARAAAAGSSSEESRSFQSFYWACVLSWAVMNRGLIVLPSLFLHGRAQNWLGSSILFSAAMAVSWLWTLAFLRSIWQARPKSWRGAVLWPYGASFAVALLTALTFFWAPYFGGSLLAIPFITLNAFGFIWALFVGSWRWRAMKQERVPVAIPAGPTEAVTAPTPGPAPAPTLSGLRTFELMAIVFAGVLLMALVVAATIMFAVLRRSSPHF